MALAYCSSNFPHLPRGSLLCKNELPYKCSSQQVGRGGANFPVSARRRLRLVNSIAPEASSQSPPQTCSAGPEMQTQTWEFRGVSLFVPLFEASRSSCERRENPSYATKKPSKLTTTTFRCDLIPWVANLTSTNTST